MNKQVDINKLIQVLVNNLELAQKRGKYTFKESANIYYAFDLLKKINEKQVDINAVMQVFVKHLEVAQQKGTYTFLESANIYVALDTLKNLKTQNKKLATINESDVEEI